MSSFTGTGSRVNFRQRDNGINQSELYRDTLKAYGKGTDQQFDALDAIRITKVSAAKEFEDFRRLPKYTHIPLAVIHPSPVKRLAKPRRPDPDFEVESSPQRLYQRPAQKYEIPDALMRPPMEISGGKKPRPKSSLGFGTSQPRFGATRATRTKGSNFQDRADAERSKQDAERNRVINGNIKIVHEAIKECLDKPDDEVFNETLSSSFMTREAKNCLKYHDLMRKINKHLQGMDMSSINKLQYRNLVQVFTKRVSDSSINDIFNSFTKKSDSRNVSRNDDQNKNRDLSRDQSSPKRKAKVEVSPRSNVDTRLEISTLQTKFETFCKNQDSLSSILNVKVIKQRFLDFQTKLKVWRKRERFPKSLKKRFKRNIKSLNELFEYVHQTFQANDTQIVHEANQIYADFQDYLRKCYRNEKVMNNFLSKLPETAQNIDPEDLSRMILKEETAHMEKHELFQQFVANVKAECVMQVHFFNFTSLPDLIVRKNYTRKQYEGITKLLVAVKDAYLEQRAREQEMAAAEEDKDGKDHFKPKTDQNVITEEDMVEIQLLDDFLTTHQRKFEQRKMLWNTFIQRAKDEIREKLETLKEQKPTQKQIKLIEQYVFSNMINTALEKNHEEMFEYHFKHELMHNSLAQKKHSVMSPQALVNKFKLIIGCEDPNYKLQMAHSPTQGSANTQGFGDRHRGVNFSAGLEDRMTTKTNFWGINFEVPMGHTYSTQEDLKEARGQLKRWSEEWREKKAGEMELFTGKRDISINEGETASTVSQSRVSNKADKAAAIANQAQKQFGGMERARHGDGGRNVQFADGPSSPEHNRAEMREGGSDGKDAIKNLDKALAGYEDEFGIGGDGGLPVVTSLGELSKSKSRVDRDMDELQEEIEEAKQLAAQEQDIKQHFIDINSGKQYDPDKRFGVIEDGTQLVYDNITTSYEMNLPPDYYLKYVQDNLPKEDAKKWFIRPHHIESLTNHFHSLKDDVLNTRYYSHYEDGDKGPPPTDNETAIDYIEKHLEQLRMKQNVMTLAKTNGEKDFEQYIEELKGQTQSEAYHKFNEFIKDKNPRPSSKQLCIEAYESILTNERMEERRQLNMQRHKEFEKNRPPAQQWYELKSKDFSKELYRNRVALKPNNSNKVYLDTLQDPYLY